MYAKSFQSKFRFAIVALLLTLLAAHAQAGTGGRQKGISATRIYTRYWTLLANTSYVIETRDLSSGADTVLHVQSYPGGQFLAGNDDCCAGLRSSVSIAASPSARNVWIVVRAYGSSSAGTGTLRITPNPGASTDFPISFTAGYVKTFSSLAHSSHLLTVEEQGGTNDTVVLVTRNTASEGFGFDDDAGVGYMSWVHLVDGSCSSYCRVYVGSYDTAGTTTFIWDENAHEGANCDGDTMSDVLETAIGTNPCVLDTDADAINDDVEVMGIDAFPSILKFPYYGADPLKPDIFVEADWEKCTPANRQDWTCGNPDNPNYDHWQVPGDQAVNTASYYAPDFAVHMDIGRTNTDPSTWFKYGNWGGATRHDARTGDKCEWLDTARIDYFHGGRIKGAGAGNSYLSKCFDSGYAAPSIPHELGHNFNLGHFADKTGGVRMNCAPNYNSIMSYATISSPSFSRGQFAGVILSPTYADEMYGLGTADAGAIAHLQNFGYRVDGGAVDWNRDGRFSSGIGRAAFTWAGSSCYTSGYQHDAWAPTGGYRYTALSHRPLSGYSSEFFWFTRREADSKVVYRVATDFPDHCATPPPDTCKTNWSPPVSQDGTVLSSSVAGDSAPAATWYHFYGSEYVLILVYNDLQHKLRYQTYRYVPEVGLTWSNPAYVPDADEVNQDPAAVTINGEAYVYAISNGALKQWKYGSSQNWMESIQRWASDSSPILADYGIGITRGYVRPSVSEVLVAAIPLSNPAGQIELAWKDPASDYWTRLADAKWPRGKAFTGAQPGLAYEPFGDGSVSDGRFYLAWIMPAQPDGTPYPALMTQSEGNNNDPAASDRRMVWDQSAIFYTDEWGLGIGNVSLLFDLTYDQNVRGAFTWVSWSPNPAERWRQPAFAPIADGIFHGGLKDQDDYAVIGANLVCGVKGTPCPL